MVWLRSVVTGRRRSSPNVVQEGGVLRLNGSDADLFAHLWAVEDPDCLLHVSEEAAVRIIAQLPPPLGTSRADREKVPALPMFIAHSASSKPASVAPAPAGPHAPSPPPGDASAPAVSAVSPDAAPTAAVAAMRIPEEDLAQAAALLRQLSLPAFDVPNHVGFHALLSALLDAASTAPAMGAETQVELVPAQAVDMAVTVAPSVPPLEGAASTPHTPVLPPEHGVTVLGFAVQPPLRPTAPNQPPSRLEPLTPSAQRSSSNLRRTLSRSQRQVAGADAALSDNGSRGGFPSRSRSSEGGAGSQQQLLHTSASRGLLSVASPHSPPSMPRRTTRDASAFETDTQAAPPAVSLLPQSAQPSNQIAVAVAAPCRQDTDGTAEASPTRLLAPSASHPCMISVVPILDAALLGPSSTVTAPAATAAPSSTPKQWTDAVADGSTGLRPKTSGTQSRSTLAAALLISTPEASQPLDTSNSRRVPPGITVRPNTTAGLRSSDRSTLKDADVEST
jgi:hypothetical protein